MRSFEGFDWEKTCKDKKKEEQVQTPARDDELETARIKAAKAGKAIKASDPEPEKNK